MKLHIFTCHFKVFHLGLQATILNLISGDQGHSHCVIFAQRQGRWTWGVSECVTCDT